MNTHRKPTEYADVCVLYGVSGDIEVWNSFYQFLINWLKNHGFTPNQLGINGQSWSGRPGKFERLNSKILKKGFAEIQDVEVRCTSMDEPTFNSKWNMFASISPRMRMCAIVSVSNSNSALVSPRDHLIEYASEKLRPVHGFCTKRSIDKAPELFVVGLTSADSRESEPQRSEVFEWAHNQELQEGVVLRDVYPMSYLTEKRLTQLVDGVTLMDWINASENRGRLTPLANGYAWHVPEADIPRVRDELNSAGLLYQLPPPRPKPPPLSPEAQAKVDAIREELYRNIGVTPERRT